MKRLLLLVALVSGCTFGTSGGEVFQAEGVTLVVTFQDPASQAPRQPRELSGELLAVEADGFVVDAVGDTGAPTRVVRVPFEVISSGEVLAGRTTGTAPVYAPALPAPSAQRARNARRPPRSGVRRVGALGRRGVPSRGVDLEALSRFPDGIPPPLLARLLDARGQNEVLTHLDAPSRPSPLD